MHALHITFDATQTPEELEQPFAEYAEALRSMPGLQSKTWIVSGQTFGGFHVFDDRTAAEGYLASDLAAGLMATPGFSNFTVTHFDVLADVSAATGVSSRPALAAG